MANVTLVAAVAASTVLALLALRRVIRGKNLQYWLGAYLRSLIRTQPQVDGPIDIVLCIVDHFEPAWNRAPLDVQRRRVATWLERFPALARRHRDADGTPLRYTFFYPAEEYLPEHLDNLAKLRRLGIADVEVHLHHDSDTSEHLRATLLDFAETLHRDHGLLRRNPATGVIEYAFIHGNWALDNSMPDGSWCGVNDEITVLKETGCYADFTFPSAPSETQPATINQIYYAVDDPKVSKSHNTGVEVQVGATPKSDLLLITGPLTLNWRNRSRGILPRIESSDLEPENPPTPQRADLWVRQHIHVKGRPEWLFVKLHTHGAEEQHSEVILGGALDRTLTYFEQRYNDGQRYRLHYVTAREMYNIVKAAEAGCTGNAGAYRDWPGLVSAAARRFSVSETSVAAAR